MVTLEELESIGVRGNLREAQLACRAEMRKAGSLVTEVIKIAAGVGPARKRKVVLERSSAQMIEDMGKVHTKLDGTTQAVLVAKVQKKELKLQMRNLGSAT